MDVKIKDLSPPIRELAIQRAQAQYPERSYDQTLNTLLSVAFTGANTPEGDSAWRILYSACSLDEQTQVEQDFIKKFKLNPTALAKSPRVGQRYIVIVDHLKFAKDDDVTLCYDDGTNSPGFCLTKDYKEPFSGPVTYIPMDCVVPWHDKLFSSVPKLSIGDHVEYYRHATPAEWETIENIPIDDRDSYLGKKGYVREVSEWGVLTDQSNFRFPPHCFRLVQNEQIPVPPTPSETPLTWFKLKADNVLMYGGIMTDTELLITKVTTINGSIVNSVTKSKSYENLEELSDEWFQKLLKKDPTVKKGKLPQKTPEPAQSLVEFKPSWMAYSDTHYEFVISCNKTEYQYTHNIHRASANITHLNPPNTCSDVSGLRELTEKEELELMHKYNYEKYSNVPNSLSECFKPILMSTHGSEIAQEMTMKTLDETGQVIGYGPFSIRYGYRTDPYGQDFFDPRVTPKTEEFTSRIEDPTIFPDIKLPKLPGNFVPFDND